MLQTNPSSSFTIISNHHFAEVRQDNASLAKSLYSTMHFLSGDVLTAFGAAAILKTPTYLTVQTGIEEHIHLKPEFLKFINHSCDPNVFFDTSAMQLIALREIEPGDEFTFFYPSTEWSMAQPFECLCGSSKCLKYISGAATMDRNLLKNYKLTKFIEQMLSTKAEQS